MSGENSKRSNDNPRRLIKLARREAKQFLDALHGADSSFEKFCFQTFDDGEPKNSELAGNWTGYFARDANRLEQLNQQRAGIFVTVNKTDGNGRRNENVTNIRAVFVDLDGAPLDPVLAWELKPHIVVESSPGKFHAYWRVDDSVTLEDFGPLQRKLAVVFKGDPAVHDLPRVLRLPGAWHQKGEPFQTRIVSTTDAGDYSRADFEQPLADIEDPAPSSSRPRSESAGRRIVPEDDWAIERFARYLRDEAPEGVKGESRHDTSLSIIQRGYDWACEAETILSGMLEWNETKCFPSLDYDHLKRNVDTAPASRKSAIGCDHPLAPGFTAVEIDESKKPTNIPPQCQDGKGPPWRQDKPASADGKLLKSSAAFTEFVAPDYLLDGILMRQYIYSLTARTGAGKTAVALLWACSVASGNDLCGREVQQGRVVYFAGENSLDVKMRWLAMAEHMGFDHQAIDVHFLDGTGKLSELATRIAEEVKALGGAALVVVDTCAAYFEGDDDNSNVQMLDHAKRLRELAKMDGGPTVLVLCHPVKNASDDSLVPRGGGSFVNEMDGNLTCRIDDKVSTVHWYLKFRGAPFEPMAFEMCGGVTAEALIDSKGRKLPTVIAKALDARTETALEEQARHDEDAVLATMLEHSEVSVAGLAVHLGWYTRGEKPGPYKSKVSRVLERLKKHKLVSQERDNHYVLTKKGKAAARRAPRESKEG